MGIADDAKKTIWIEYMVASTSISNRIDLISVAKALEDADYNPKRFPGLVYRNTDPKSRRCSFYI